ncbi:MAG: sugar phosphate isomerase/epimerase [Clostridia bacterium]|nr:sugar phosphate isomerase/epimerase [Clostridia bacterium]
MKLQVGVNIGGLMKYKDDPEKFIDIEEGIDIIAEAGFDTIDFNVGRGFARVNEGQDFTEVFTGIRKYAESKGVRIHQTHARVLVFEETLTDRFYDMIVEDIKATALLGAKYIVIHPLKPRFAIYDRFADYRKEINLAFFKRLKPVLEEYGITECIENLFHTDEERGVCCPAACSRPEEILGYLDELGTDNFGVCLDTGHMLLTGDFTGDTIPDAIRKFGKNLKVLHVHDNHKIRDDHYAPFMGLTDWKAVIDALEEVGFDGVFSLEIMPHRFLSFDRKVWKEGYKFFRKICDTEEMSKGV